MRNEAICSASANGKGEETKRPRGEKDLLPACATSAIVDPFARRRSTRSDSFHRLGKSVIIDSTGSTWQCFVLRVIEKVHFSSVRVCTYTGNRLAGMDHRNRDLFAWFDLVRRRKGGEKEEKKRGKEKRRRKSNAAWRFSESIRGTIRSLDDFKSRCIAFVDARYR